jgi:[ribosomal protein S18]-alanine N-acetyltransferase
MANCAAKSEVVYQKIDDRWFADLVEFFEILLRNGDDRFFHPHPLDRDKAKWIASYEGEDLYYGQFIADRMIGYGILRGWDEGYDIPSLGIVITPSERGRGFGKQFMHFLHAETRLRGAKKVRLKVYQNNKKALKLYQQLGYSFMSSEGDQLVGHIEL